ncbi:MAG: low temperature requirement protein A [Clostridia bacterium]|nr:low temperature requirement protein A [Clostridia bacterium]
MKLLNNEEKKVEYLELIYDLIFVYIIGHNNSLLHGIENGFFSFHAFLTYLTSSLAIIQIWNFSTFFTNMYGKNGVRDHIFIFINMYLLYYIGEGTRIHWESFQNQYHIAWALILINIGVQYVIEWRNQKGDSTSLATIRGLMIAIFGEVALILIAIPVFNRTGVQIAPVAILYGVFATFIFADRTKSKQVDFMHLSERAMLYVVFTFGEMIIAIASYFEGGFSPNSIYFSLMCFLIVAGLFLCYEILYNSIVDREMQTSGMGYMMIHILLIFGLNNITTSLEFMHDTEVALMPKTLFLISSFLLLFMCMFLLLIYAKPQMKRCKKFLIPTVISSVLFAVMMVVLREKMYLNIALSVVYVYTTVIMLYRFSKQGNIINA